MFLFSKYKPRTLGTLRTSGTFLKIVIEYSKSTAGTLGTLGTLGTSGTFFQIVISFSKSTPGTLGTSETFYK